MSFLFTWELKKLLGEKTCSKGSGGWVSREGFKDNGLGWNGRGGEKNLGRLVPELWGN